MIEALALCGPTASGKTALSLALAERLGAEIISCDSMQVYRGLDIGTAKATPEERARIPHHVIDLVAPDEAFSVEHYRRAALCAADGIAGRGRLPLIVGGTGLYLDALMRRELPEIPACDVARRDACLSEIKTPEDAHRLWERLKACDPASAAAIHENNVRRVFRALEIYEKTGKPKSYFDGLSREGDPPLRISVITLDFHCRENLYARVNARVDEMMRAGLAEEAERLFRAGLLDEGSTAAQAIGYKELALWLRGEVELAEVVELVKLATRRYAKRQLTWFRHVESDKIMLDDEGGNMRPSAELLDEALAISKKRLNL